MGGAEVIAAIVTMAALLAAGFGLGRARQRSLASHKTSLAISSAVPRQRSRAASIVILVVIGFPIATILLAKLFQSDVLGWIFGLTLMLMAALVPCAAIFFVGMKLGARSQRTRALVDVKPSVKPNVQRDVQFDAQPGASSSPTTTTLLVDVERDDVHSSDDAPSRQVAISPTSSLRALIDLAMADRYLPSISGGKATWIIESSGPGHTPIAVCAQQWAEPVMLVAATTSVEEHYAGEAPRLYFRYRSQIDPHTVLDLHKLAHVRIVEKR
jgi:hypothetical protein